jgi:hypothetical protein
MSRTLQEHSPEEQQRLAYHELTALRRQAYRAHLAAMAPSLTIAAWTKAMAKKYDTATARAHFNAVSWPVALLIARYGEEPAYWPSAFSAEDVKRAEEWLSAAKFSFNVEPLTEGRVGDLMTTMVVDQNTGKLVPFPLHGLDEEG